MTRKTSKAQQATSAPPSNSGGHHVNGEVVSHDDLCPICHVLLYKPVITRCGHTMCESCMTLWAEISINQQMAIVGLDDQPMTLHPSELEIKCPMCRTPSTATLDQNTETLLRAQYPQTYLQRQTEEQAAAEDDFADSVETLTIYIGNTHQRIKADSEDSQNKHNWKFFVHPSRTDLIEEVQIFLHPTFRNHSVVVQFPPYEIRRLGWGTFTIYASIILKAGYSWMTSEAEDAPDGGRNGKLPVEWTLDFNGRGSQGRCRLKVKKEKEGQDLEEAAQREAVTRLWRQQRERDPDWVETE